MLSNIEIIDFSDLFISNIQHLILDEVYRNKLFDNNNHMDIDNTVKLIIDCYMTQNIDKVLKRFNIMKKVICVQPYILDNNAEIYNYCDRDSLNKLLIKLLLKFSKTHKNRVIFFDKVFDINNKDIQMILFKKCN